MLCMPTKIGDFKSSSGMHIILCRCVLVYPMHGTIVCAQSECQSTMVKSGIGCAVGAVTAHVGDDFIGEPCVKFIILRLNQFILRHSS
jgi:hypothetical protein